MKKRTKKMPGRWGAVRIGDHVRRRGPNRDERVFEIALPSCIGHVDVELERESGEKQNVKIPRVVVLLYEPKSHDADWVELGVLFRDYELVSG